jgi:hypothetical protein
LIQYAPFSISPARKPRVSTFVEVFASAKARKLSTRLRGIYTRRSVIRLISSCGYILDFTMSKSSM